MSNALPLSMSHPNAHPMPQAPRSHWNLVPLRMDRGTAYTTAPLAVPAPRPVPPLPLFVPPPVQPAPAPVVMTMPERMLLARSRIRRAAETGQRIRSYEVALDLDLSEFHFARQFRLAFGTSPHLYYDACRAERARVLLGEGLSESDVARRVGFRRPAELRALLEKHGDAVCP